MVVDDFIGCNAHKTIFIYNYTKQLNISKNADSAEPFVISYYGVGGVDKTYLEEKLRNIAKEADKNINI